MVPSVDGRIVRVVGLRSILGLYDEIAETFRADAWIAGRVSMEAYAGKAKLPKRAPRIPKVDYIAPSTAKSYGIAVDPSGKLMWKSSQVGDDHMITILSETVSNNYLSFLRSKGVSYLFGGRRQIDVPNVLSKLRRHFGIRRLLLEGGGKINGSFLAANVIDELSLLIAPGADGKVGEPALFDIEESVPPLRNLRLIAMKRLRNDVVWIRYKFKRAR
jgi:2,5-diamino-6-(ribosylamino)-4(3H)-pyrimidinone 5'-phosphate reductase